MADYDLSDRCHRWHGGRFSHGVHRAREPAQRLPRRDRQARRHPRAVRAHLRRAHRSAEPRGALLSVLSEDCDAARDVRDQRSVLVVGGRQVLWLLADEVARRGDAAHGAPAAARLHPGHQQAEVAAQPAVPARLACHRRLRALPRHPQAGRRRRLEERDQGRQPRRALGGLQRQQHALDDAAGVHRLRRVRAVPVYRPADDPADQVRPEAALLRADRQVPRRRAREARDRGRLQDQRGARLRHELGRVRDQGRRPLRDRLHQPGARHVPLERGRPVLRHPDRRDGALLDAGGARARLAAGGVSGTTSAGARSTRVSLAARRHGRAEFWRLRHHRGRRPRAPRGRRRRRRRGRFSS